MNWYKKSQEYWYDTAKEQGVEVSESLRDNLDKMFGLGKYEPEPSKKKKERKTDCEPMHSMDMHCDGEDDGW